MPRRFSTWKPDVVSVTRCPTIRETIQASRRIPARRGRDELVAAFLGGEARADGDVGLATQHRLEDPRELRRIVLPVSVDADSDVEAVLERETEARLHGAADAEVERQAERDCTIRSRDLARAVDGAVVDDDDHETGVERAQLVDDPRHGQLFVQRRDDGDAAQLRESGGAAAGAAASTVSGTGGHRNVETEQLEELPRPVRVRVLVEHALARAAAELLGLRRDRRAAPGRPPSPRPRPRRRCTSRPGSNQRSIPSCGFETIAAAQAASSNRRHVDDA